MLALPLVSQTARAQPYIFEAWQQRYSSPVTTSRQCQLCHQRAEGGDGWNAYGFDIRTVFLDQLGGTNIDQAFTTVEPFNSDEDPLGLSNVAEISANLDPGWKPGANNRIFFKDGTVLTGQRAPFQEGDQGDACFVIQAGGKTIAFCL